MPVFRVSSRTANLPGRPKKRSTRIRQRWYGVLRIHGGLIILAMLTTLAITKGFYIFLILLPVCTGIVVTRSQLSNLLHGTLVYGLLTICLAVIYFGSITGVQLLLHAPGLGWLPLKYVTVDSLILIVTTALFLAAAFEPVRASIQAEIEQRFNIRNREAVKAVEAFTSKLREEIDLDKVRDGLLAVVQQTMQPRAVSVWVRKVEQDDMGRLPTDAGGGENDWQRQDEGRTQDGQKEPAVNGLYGTSPLDITVARNDPFIVFARSHPGVMEVDRLQMASPILPILQANEVEIALPLTSQGELIGLLTLGTHLNGEEYGREERSLLNMLTAQVAPALRVAQVVQEQQVQVRERERIEQELRTAQDIQLSLLPKDVPLLPGWQIAPYYRPAREVGGDFYDFLPFEDGRLGIILGDVTGKGVPAALVMATTRTMLRAVAQEQVSPGEVLARVNELLSAEIPPKMFVTCFYAILDPGSGRLCYANAGQDLPYRWSSAGVSELWATGMPLGMMPGTCYEEHEVTLAPGEGLLFYSDGLVEAHNSQREMFDTPRLKAVLEEHTDGASLIDFLLGELQSFTGEGWEQEDDVTMVTLSRSLSSPAPQAEIEQVTVMPKSESCEHY